MGNLKLLFLGNPNSSFQRDMYQELKKYFDVSLVRTSPLRKDPLALIRVFFQVLLRSRSVDIIFVEFLAHYTFIVALLKKLGIIRAPIVVRCHRFEVFTFAGRFRFAFALAAKLSSLIICVSRRTWKKLLKLVPEAKKKTVIIYNGVDTNRFRPLSREENKIFTIGSLGFLTMRKGFIELVDSIKELIDEGINVKLRIGGKGPLYDMILERIRKYKLEDAVKLDGFIPNNKLTEWYNKLDLFVLNSRSEGHPIVILEAMSCGLPVIATLVDDLDEVLGEEWLYKFGDWRRLKALIKTLYTMPKEEREKLGIKNREKVLKEYNLTTQAKRIADMIKQLYRALSKN